MRTRLAALLLSAFVPAVAAQSSPRELFERARMLEEISGGNAG